MGSASGGVWTSDNGGTTWTPRTDSQPDLAIGAVAVDPNNADHIVAGTGEANQSGDSFSGDGILNSTDGGTTWSRQDPGGVFDGASVSQLAIDPTSSVREFAATTAGLFETADGGTTWAQPTDASYTLDVAGRITGVVVDSAGTVRVASATGAWVVSQSVDHGATFTETDTGVAHDSGALVVIAVAPSSPTTLYVSVGGFAGMTFWKNTTGGAGTWTQLTGTPDYTGQAYAYGSGTAEQGWYDNTVAVDPTNANHVVAGGIAAIETTNGGTSWTNVNGQTFFGGGTNRIHPDQHALAFRTDGKILIGDDGGVFLYDPTGPTVTNLQGNLNISQFYFGFNEVGGQVLGGTQDNSSALYTGSTAWTGIFSGDGGPSAITANHPATMFIESDESLFVTTDAFVSTRTNITPPTSGQNFTPPMVVVPSTSTPANPTVYFGGGEGLWRTTNPTTGATWTDITGVVGAVSAIAVAPSDPNTIYVGLDDGTILVSFNGGTTFVGLPTQPFAGTANWVTGLAVNPSNNLELTASFSYNATRTFIGSPHIARFNGVSWSNLTGTGLPAQAVGRVVYDAGALVAATDTGVYASTDNGATWASVGTGLPNVQVMDLDVEADGLYAATHGRGVWKLPTQAPSWQLSVPPQGGTTSNFTGVSAISASDVWAVGSYTAGGVQWPLTGHWNGTAWTLVVPPQGGTTSTFTGVAAISTNDVWAVGSYTQGGVQWPLTGHWNGTAWTLVVPPQGGTTSKFTSVTAIATNDVWAVGSYTQAGVVWPLTAHWNGTAWTLIVPPRGGTTSTFTGVTAIATNDVWAVGSYTAGGVVWPLTAHWNGTAWTLIAPPQGGTTSNFTGVAAINTNDVWAVGSYTAGGVVWPLTAHWNGTAWTLIVPPQGGATSTFTGVTAIATNDVWAVGSYTAGGVVWPLTAHWNGTAWTLVVPPQGGTTSNFTAVSAISTSNVWAVGSYTAGGVVWPLAGHFS